MNDLQRRVFALRADLWQLADARRLHTEPGTELTEVINALDDHLHAVEGILRTVRVSPQPTEDDTAAVTDDPATIQALAAEIHQRYSPRGRIPVDRIVELLTRQKATGAKPSRLARDMGISYDAASKYLGEAARIRAGF